MTKPRKLIDGFTLLEVLVALAVVAIALGAAVRLSGNIIDGTQGIKERTLGRWIAQNEINKRLLAANANNPPALGAKNGETTMGGIRFRWQEDVSSTEDQSYRRIEVRVYNEQDQDFAVASVIGYINMRGVN